MHTGRRARARARLLATAAVACGCAAGAPPGTELSRGSISDERGSRAFALRVPAGLAPGEARPLLVALHGCLQTAEQLAGAARLDALAEAERIFVLYPVQGEANNPGRCWNWFSREHQARDRGEPALVKAMIDEVRRGHAIDPARIYLTGLSAGGFMASILFACYPEVFAAAAIVSGGMYGAADNLEEGMAAIRAGSPHDPGQRGEQAWRCAAERAARAYPLLVIDGDADRTVAAVNARQAVEQFLQTNDYADDGRDNDSVKALGAPSRSRPDGRLEYTCRAHVVQDRALMRHCTVHGLGHAWSGGDARFPYAEPDGPDATGMIWSFFAEHARPPE